MRIVRLNNASEIIRACYTEDKLFCTTAFPGVEIWTAIDKTVATELDKLTSGVYCYRVETDDGHIAGFALIGFNPRAVVDTFIRPVHRPQATTFIAEVNNFKNTALAPIV